MKEEEKQLSLVKLMQVPSPPRMFKRKGSTLQGEGGLGLTPPRPPATLAWFSESDHLHCTGLNTFFCTVVNFHK